MLKSINIKQYYKSRIIITFAAVTIVIVIIIARSGYLFIKDLYLKQLSDQAGIVASMIARQIDPAYLDLLEIGNPTGATEKYFRSLLEKNTDLHLHEEIFLFEYNYTVAIHSDPSFTPGEKEPRLIMNGKEISELKTGNSVATLPFKGEDDKWYLWGFYRLNENYYLAVRESAERFEEVDELSFLFWIIGIGGVILSVAAGWLMGNAMTKPLSKLADFSNQIGRGNFQAAPPEKMHGEIKLLSDAMDKMKTDLAGHQEEKEKILAQIAHEIRNPLGGILLLVNLIKENQDDYEKNKEYLEKIIKEINGLKMLITSYLNYSRPLFPEASWVDINKALTEIENIFKVQLKERNILVIKKLNLEKIYFDEGHFKQIMVNLMANSLEAMTKNGSIVITSNSNPNWEISFTDDGPGIEEENYQNVFNPFFTTKKNGTGLGLAICRKLSFENNAELSALKNGKGATFVLTKKPVL